MITTIPVANSKHTMITGITTPTIIAVELEEEESTAPELFSVPVKIRKTYVAIHTPHVKCTY